MKTILIFLFTLCTISSIYSKEVCGIKTMKIRQLNDKEQKVLENYKFWVNDILKRGFQLNEKLTGNKSDLDLLQLVVNNGPYGDNIEDELIIIGSLFGNILEKELGMNWIIYEDEKGIDFALSYKNKCVFSFPQSMLLKRAEKGELGDLTDLYNETVKILKKEIANPEVKTW